MTCSICQHRAKRNYHKIIMGGPPGLICWYCFQAWYDHGLTNAAEILRESVRLREEREEIARLQEPRPTSSLKESSHGH